MQLAGSQRAPVTSLRQEPLGKVKPLLKFSELSSLIGQRGLRVLEGGSALVQLSLEFGNLRR